ncbi:hypothetical protein ABZP36_007465 [Zizania latifolia]
MPNPKHPAPTGGGGGGGGGPVDSEWKYFLDNVREEPRGSYSVKVPADGANPSSYIEYEKPRDGSRPTNGEPRGASSSSSSSPGWAGRKRPMEAEEKDKSGGPAWYDANPDIDESYRIFLQHVRVEEDCDMVFEYKGTVIRYGEKIAGDGGSSKSSVEAAKTMLIVPPDECEPNPLDRPTAQPKDKENGENVKVTETMLIVLPDECEPNPLDRPAAQQKDKENGENVKVAETMLIVPPDECEPNPLDRPAAQQKDKENGENVKVAKMMLIVLPDECEPNPLDCPAAQQKDKENGENVKVAKTMLIVPPDECEPNPLDRPVAQQKDKENGENVKVEKEIVEKGKENVVDVDEIVEIDDMVENMKDLEKAANVKKAKIVKKDKEVVEIMKTDQGVIWPTHINEREESDFKQRLMHVLSKPFNQEEYDKLFVMATIHNPITKERRMRCGVKYYHSEHEKSKSYFDRYPELAKQVEETSYPNQLALLRGFFFWLENIGQEDQFRPWRDDHKQYKVVFF